MENFNLRSQLRAPGFGTISSLGNDLKIFFLKSTQGHGFHRDTGKRPEGGETGMQICASCVFQGEGPTVQKP